jgi:hypothetical protein
MKRAFVALVLVCSCSRLEQSRARSTASRLESKHLAEVQRIADGLEKSPCARPPGISPVAGTSLERDPAVADVEVACQVLMRVQTTRLHGTYTKDDGYYEIGIGKDADAGFQPGRDAEETVKVPSMIAPKANDLCIQRPHVKICVAYRD